MCDENIIYPEEITGVLGQILDEVDLPEEIRVQVYDLYKRAVDML